jgi:hypothetical protein
MPNQCPICQSQNAVQKVSAIVSNGNAQVSIAGPVIDTSGDLGISFAGGNFSTPLAKFLSPPPEPRNDFLQGERVEIYIKFVLYFFGVPLLGFIVAEIFSATFNADFFMGIAFLSSFFGFIPGFILGYKRVLKPMYLKRDRRHFETKKIWNEAMKTWSRLYYCHRDDVVFDPRSKVSFPPSRMLEYLASNKN